MIDDVLGWAGLLYLAGVAVLAGRRNLAIWSYDPAEYTGQWSAYLGAWHLVDAELERARARGARWPVQGRLV